MVAVYGSFEEGQAARPKAANFRKYAGALVGAWAVLFVAAVLIVGEQPSHLGALRTLAACCPMAGSRGAARRPLAAVSRVSAPDTCMRLAAAQFCSV